MLAKPTKTVKKKKIEKLGEAEAKELVLNYLKEQYRPYGVTDIIQNLHGKVSKTVMSTVLERLLSEGELVSKTYGKSSFYCYKEIIDESNSGNQAPVVTMESLSQLKDEYIMLDRTFKTLKEEYSNQESEKSNAELLVERAKLIQNIQDIDLQLSRLNNGTDQESAKQQLANLMGIHNKASIEYQKRLKMYRNVVGQIMDSVDDYKGFLKTMGVEDHCVISIDIQN